MRGLGGGFAHGSEGVGCISWGGKLRHRFGHCLIQAYPGVQHPHFLKCSLDHWVFLPFVYFKNI